MPEYKTPGVYIEEIPKLPPSIASVETAIPAFIGYTEKAKLKEDDDLHMVPYRISSMLEYEKYFGFAEPEDGIEVVFTNAGTPDVEVIARIVPADASVFNLYYSMQMSFANGGGPCYIISIGTYASSGGTLTAGDFEDGIDEAAKVNEITLLVA